MAFCILGMLVVKGVGSTDASVYKSGEDEIKCDYSCVQDVKAVEVAVIYHSMVSPVSVDWILTDSYFYVRSPMKEYVARVAVNDRFVKTIPDGFIKPPNYTKYINDYSPTNKRTKEVIAGGSGGMPYDQYNHSYSL